MFKSEAGFTFVETMLSLLILAIVFTLLSTIFINGIGIIQLSQIKTDALNRAQNSISQSILATNGNNQNVTLVFNEGQTDEISFNIDSLLITETESYTRRGNTNEITIQYLEVVMP